MDGEEVAPGVILAGGGGDAGGDAGAGGGHAGHGGSPIPEDAEVEGPVWIGRDVRIGDGARLTGPLVLGDGARVGAGAQLRESILFPGTEVAPGAILIGAIAGHAGILDSLRRRQK
jgi:NDP-sugar pyrophosphorylase family protein